VRAVMVMAGLFPDGSYETWAVCERLHAHVVAVTQHVPDNRSCVDALDLMMGRKAVFDRL